MELCTGVTELHWAGECKQAVVLECEVMPTDELEQMLIMIQLSFSGQGLDGFPFV
jgi:hypothetical protein